MKPFCTEHIIFLIVVVIFLVATMKAISKMSKRWQNVMFIIGATICAGGIFFRYGLGLRLDGTFTFGTLLKEMLQVCNFNLILVILMLIPRFELARQYSIFFSMFAASTTLISLSSSWVNLPWYHIDVMNSLINHVFAIALPLWMLASRRLKPRKEYVWKVTICVVLYFTLVAIIVTILMNVGVITDPVPHYSFIYDTYGIGIFDFLYSLIPLPFLYLVPIMPFMVLFFFFLAWAFNSYKVKDFK